MGRYLQDRHQIEWMHQCVRRVCFLLRNIYYYLHHFSRAAVSLWPKTALGWNYLKFGKNTSLLQGTRLALAEDSYKQNFCKENMSQSLQPDDGKPTTMTQSCFPIFPLATKLKKGKKAKCHCHWLSIYLKERSFFKKHKKKKNRSSGTCGLCNETAWLYIQ